MLKDFLHEALSLQEWQLLLFMDRVLEGITKEKQFLFQETEEKQWVGSTSTAVLEQDGSEKTSWYSHPLASDEW